jgi:drug/metabolite transporter (DMT)-like permease
MFTISKAALFYAQPLFFMSFRMIGAGIILAGYMYYVSYKHKRPFLCISPGSLWLLGQATLFHIFITYTADLWALDKITSTESAFIYNLSPFITAMFSYYWFNERMTLKKWIGFGLGFASIIPILYNNTINVSFTQIDIIAKFVTLIAVVSSAYGWILVRELVKNRNYSTISVNSITMFFGGIMALGTSWLVEPWSPSPVTAWVPFVEYTLIIIVVANIIFYNLYGYLLRTYTATFLSFAGFTCPFFAAFFGWLFLNESLSYAFVLSFALVTCGLYIFYQEELKQGYIKSDD